MTSLQVGHDINAKIRTADVAVDKNITFKDLFLSPNVLLGLNKAGFYHPSPIQLNAIPFGRCGLDLIVQAKSGTGKTCVFSVIAMETIITTTSSLQVLVLAPTREIAVQITSVMEAIGQSIKGLVVACFIGGRPVSDDKVNVKGCHIAVGTPGRVFQLVELGILSCENVRLFVLDEADKLLEDNFQSQINSIYSMLPMNKQMIAASATYPEELAQFVTKYMQDPTFVRLNPKDMVLLGIRQYIFEIPLPYDKYTSNFDRKIKATVNLLEVYNFRQALVFSNYHSHAKDLSDACNCAGLSATYISGNMDQAKRLEAMAMLKDYKCRVLISTDLTSRGIDASNVDLVLNLDVPYDWETYMHRTGRAGRFGSLGAVISVVLTGEEKASLLEITKAYSIPVYPIACTDRKITIGAEPVTENEGNESFENNNFQNITSKSSVVRRKTKKGDVSRSKKALITQPKCQSISSGLESTPAKEETNDSKASKIPSLPDLIRFKKAPNMQMRSAYAELLQSISYFKTHGTLEDIKKRPNCQRNSATAKYAFDISGKNVSETKFSSSDRETDLTVSYRDLPDVIEYSVSSVVCDDSDSESYLPGNGTLESIAHRTRTPPTPGASNSVESASQHKKSHISHRISTLKSNSVKTYEPPKQTGLKGNVSQERRDISQHDVLKSSKKEKRRNKPKNIPHEAPMLLPRYSKLSRRIPLDTLACRSHHAHMHQSMSQWRKHHFWYLLCWNQYLLMEAWRSGGAF